MTTKIYFTVLGTGNKQDLWVSDGTTAGTNPVNSPNAGFNGIATNSFASLNGQPFFAGFDSAGHVNLFTVNTANTAVEIVTPAGSSKGLSPGGPSKSGPIAFNGKLYFQGIDQNGQYGLFTSDGTGAGTQRLQAPGSPGTNVYVDHFTRFGNLLAFGAELSTTSTGLYLTDGTAAGTRLVSVTGTSFFGPNIQSMAVAGSKLVFSGSNSANQVVLWASDGTSAGTMQLAVPGLNPTGAFSGNPSGLISFGSKAAFTATDGQGKSGIWVTDGTAAGTVELPGVTGNTYGAPMAPMSGGRLAFIAKDTAGQTGVFITDGAAVTELNVGPLPYGGLGPSAVMVLGNQLLFDGSTANNVRSLYTSDGTSAGTSVLKSGVSLLPFYVDTDAAIVGPGPSAAVASPPLFYSTNAAIIATAAPGIPGDALTATLLSDAAAPAGSSLSLNAQNQLIYQAGSITPANAGSDTLRIRVTDTITGQTADVSPAVLLAAPPVSPDPLFDARYYLAHNADVAASGLDPYAHYMTYGSHEGRNPDALFDSHYYLQQNPDVAASGLNPLTHFELYGWKEGRDPSLLFSNSAYLAANPDVAAAGLDPLLHDVVYGQAEGRMTFLSGASAPADPLIQAPYYDPQRGATLIPTGAAAAQQAAYSYATTGWQAGLNPDALFDTNRYLNNNPDVAAAHIDPLLHYEVYGWKEGRDPSAAFSTSKYLAAYADVQAANLNPLAHYIMYGQAEGRTAFHA